MKAWVLNEIGDIRLTDVRKPEPAGNEVLVRVKAAGICGSDIPRIYETGAHRMPLIPGHEFSGIVEETGNGVPDSLCGKRVTICPKIPCGECTECRRGNSDMCRNYDYVGSRRDGAFAEYVAVPADNIREIPDNVSFEAAAMIEPLAVAANAVRKGTTGMCGTDLSDVSAAVCGMGPIGMMTVLLLKEAGYGKIFEIGKNDSQKERLISLGISGKNYLDSRNGDVPEKLRDLTSGGVSVFYECVGRNECVTMGIESVAPEGSVVLVGNPYSDMELPKATYWKILRDQLKIYGVWNSSFSGCRSGEGLQDDWDHVLQKIASGNLQPERLITHRLKLGELEKGLHIMRDKTEKYCKIMVSDN